MKRKITAIAIALSIMVTLVPVAPVYAATITAGTGGDHATLAAALAAASDGDTIRLLSDISERVEYDTTGKTITIDGDNGAGGVHKITCLAGAKSAGLALSGSGIVILKDITLQGGSDANPGGESYGLYVASGSVNVKSLGSVTAIGGAATSSSVGVYHNGTGTVNVTAASGGAAIESIGVKNNNSGTVNVGTAVGSAATTSSIGVYNYSSGTVNVGTATGGTTTISSSFGVYNWGAGTLNVGTATGGTAGSYSIGAGNSDTGTVNVTTAIGGTSSTAKSLGIDNGSGIVNVVTATGGTSDSSDSFGINNYFTGTVNVGTATGGTAHSISYGVNNTNTGTVNATTAAGVLNPSGTVRTGGAYVTTLTLNKGTGASCVLDSITIAASGSTSVGALPQVTKNGVIGAWYTDSAKTIAAGTTVTGTTNLYSTFYEPYAMTASSLTAFASQTAGYASAPASQTVTVTNTGNQTITLTEPAITNASSNYSIGNLTSTTLATGSAVTFTVQPKTGLAVGTYSETINIAGSGGASTSVSAQFSVTSAGGGGSSAPTGTTTNITVNGKSENAGTTASSKEGNQTVTTVTVDDKILQEKIKAEGNNSTVSIPISGSPDVGEGVLNGQTIKDMEKKESVLEIKTNGATYTLPAAEINIDSVSSQFGQSVKLEDIKISIRIEAPTADDAKIVADTADKNNYLVVVKPVAFEITCSNESKTIAVSKFNGYVERMVAIPDGIDPSKVTTGVVLNKDGSISHVPTAIVIIDGKYYAKINSLTNSTYSVIYNPVTFRDVTKHWAKDSINNMGSRLVISGVGENEFEPNRDITRAEFAAIMVRALGLAPDATKNTFSDVAASKWYSGYVGTAASYGIISGYDADTFAPNAKITREQAMTMVARATGITGLDTAAASSNTSSPLTGYADTAKISSYAKAGVIACLNTGVATGKTADTIAPKNNITRAEVAIIIERLLKKSELI